jgi:CubicO group peptidase (beta-lactamase class C family)
VERSITKSPYNPHFPYSLQFDINTDKHIETLPSDAFWKSGSGGHCLYVVPSLNLIVWKLGGRDDQYSVINTGFPEIVGQTENTDNRNNWTKTVDTDEAIKETLKLVIDAIVL